VTVAVLVMTGDRLARAYAPGALITPILVALAPFAGGAVATVPACLLAAPAAIVSRRELA
jgi:hypothetical protein